MNITKLGHCCMVIEEAGVRIMTDPGAYSTLQDEARNIDYIFITHEHQDHFHLESLKVVLKNNPKAKIVTNRGVGKLGQVQNTGYFIANRFFYPGDAFYNPGKPVEILALPVAGPWLKISEVIDYAKLLKPKICFPVHDGMLKYLGPTRGVTTKYLSESGIEFRDAIEGAVFSF
ncbi:MAG: hypothetical protein UY03_C0028G0012 [Parcubacteria group bacterium GW2011_GWA2_47_64]|nr:MAG: hypothetical protein UY03_C0028G0012 [Parcubacteria group bacterium GW2011_GWA2_47_64]